MKKLITLIIAVLFFFRIQPVYAADLTITCGSSSSCTPTDSPSPFDGNAIWYPGYSESRSIEIVNTDTNPITVEVKAINKSQSTLNQALLLQIVRKSNNKEYFNDTLQTFFSKGSVQMEDIRNAPDEFIFTVTMDPNAGDEYQNTNQSFDLEFGFTRIIDEQKTDDNSGEGDKKSTTSTNDGGGTGGGTTTPSPTPASFISRLFTMPAAPTTAPVVEGVTTTEGALVEEGEVGGAITCKDCVWWPFLLAEILLLLLSYKGMLKQFPIQKQKLMALIIPFVLYVLFLWWNQPCVQGILVQSDSFVCRYFLLIMATTYTLLSVFCCNSQRKNT